MTENAADPAVGIMEDLSPCELLQFEKSRQHFVLATSIAIVLSIVHLTLSSSMLLLMPFILGLLTMGVMAIGMNVVNGSSTLGLLIWSISSSFVVFLNYISAFTALLRFSEYRAAIDSCNRSGQCTVRYSTGLLVGTFFTQAVVILLCTYALLMTLRMLMIRKREVISARPECLPLYAEVIESNPPAYSATVEPNNRNVASISV